MSLFGKLLPIIAGLGITAATGGFGALGLGAEAGAGAGAAGAGAGVSTAGGLAAGATDATATGTALATPAIATAAPVADAGTSLATEAASAAPTIAAPTITPAVGSISSALPSLPPEDFLTRAGMYLGNHPMLPLLGAAALLGDKPAAPASPGLNAAPVYSAPQSQPMKPGGIPDRTFQTALISNLARR